tara:strand:+ start:219 stop:1079 length:861 start_codon:yes stop_codon:yes gene_type:complete
MSFHYSLFKPIFKAIAISSFGIASLISIPKLANASTPPNCSSSDGVGSGDNLKSAAQVQSANLEYCLGTPSRFSIKIYQMGLCLSDPFSSPVATFSKNNCVTTMDSIAGVDSDLASSTVNLPNASSRPASGTYTHAFIIIGPDIGLKGTFDLSDGSGGTISYYSTNDGGVSTSSPAYNHTETINDFGDEEVGYSAVFGPEVMPTGGKVSALLTDAELIKVGSSSSVKRLVAVFETNSGSPVVLTDSTKGLEVELVVTDGGYSVEFDENGVPENFGSAPFKPVFRTF